jgi:hypothetical protein
MQLKVSIQSKDGSKVISINRRKAIREKCLNCSGWSLKDVTDCEFKGDCQLYPFRSGIGKQDAKARLKAIKDHCLWCMNGQRYEVAKCTAPDCPLFVYRKSGVDRSVNIA